MYITYRYFVFIIYIYINNRGVELKKASVFFTRLEFYFQRLLSSIATILLKGEGRRYLPIFRILVFFSVYYTNASELYTEKLVNRNRGNK